MHTITCEFVFGVADVSSFLSLNEMKITSVTVVSSSVVHVSLLQSVLQQVSL